MIRVNHIGKTYKIGKAPTSFRELLGSFLRKRQEEYFWALRDITFTISPGEQVALIGPNGSGKSTLLSILSRITYPTEGSALIQGRVASMLEVGSGFHPDLSGRENLFLSGALLGMKRREIEKRFDEIVAFAGVERFIDTAVKFYSSGMVTRLGFSIGTHLDTDILFLDEVLTVGDSAFQKRAMERVQLLAKEGKTILTVSHSEKELRSFCKRALYLDQGRLIADTTLDKALVLYQNRI